MQLQKPGDILRCVALSGLGEYGPKAHVPLYFLFERIQRSRSADAAASAHGTPTINVRPMTAYMTIAIPASGSEYSFEENSPSAFATNKTRRATMTFEARGLMLIPAPNTRLSGVPAQRARPLEPLVGRQFPCPRC